VVTPQAEKSAQKVTLPPSNGELCDFGESVEAELAHGADQDRWLQVEEFMDGKADRESGWLLERMGLLLQEAQRVQVKQAEDLEATLTDLRQVADQLGHVHDTLSHARRSQISIDAKGDWAREEALEQQKYGRTCLLRKEAQELSNLELAKRRTEFAIEKAKSQRDVRIERASLKRESLEGALNRSLEHALDKYHSTLDRASFSEWQRHRRLQRRARSRDERTLRVQRSRNTRDQLQAVKDAKERERFDRYLARTSTIDAGSSTLKRQHDSIMANRWRARNSLELEKDASPSPAEFLGVDSGPSISQRLGVAKELSIESLRVRTALDSRMAPRKTRVWWDKAGGGAGLESPSLRSLSPPPDESSRDGLLESTIQAVYSGSRLSPQLMRAYQLASPVRTCPPQLMRHPRKDTGSPSSSKVLRNGLAVAGKLVLE
jgi:hypothetical protein